MTAPTLTTQAQQIKQAAINRDRRIRRLLVPLVIAGVLVGVAVWFLADPRDRDEIHASAAIGLGLATFFVGCLLGRMLDPIPAAECPQCLRAEVYTYFHCIRPSDPRLRICDGTLSLPRFAYGAEKLATWPLPKKSGHPEKELATRNANEAWQPSANRAPSGTA